MNRREFVVGGLALSAGTRIGAARAESGPLTKIIFPFSAGGSGDILCRLLAQQISEPLDRTVVVEERNGADGLIGIRAVKGAKPDGTTILVTTGPTMFLLPMVETTPSFNRDTDFMPVSLLARFEFCVAIGPAVDARDFAGLVGWLKAHPDKTSFGVPSNGTIPHFTGSRLEEILKIPLTRVAYRGTTPIINDMMGGHLQFAVTTVADVVAQHQADRLKVLAVSSAKRSPFLPDVPTLRENGIDLVADAWYGMWLPAGSPPEFVGKLSAAVVTAVAKPEIREKLLTLGLIPVGSTQQGLIQELAANTALWQPIVKATGYKIN